MIEWFTLAPAVRLRAAGIRLIGLFLAVAAPAFAQSDSRAIDLETAVARALQSNLGIESEMASVRQKRLVADTWWNRFYPSASAGYTLGRRNTDSTVSGVAPVQSDPGPSPGTFDSVAPFEQEQPRWFMSANVDLSLVLTLQMIPGISLARLDYENGLITLDEARARVERDVSKQFYELLLLQRRIALQEEQIENAQARFEQAQANFDAGLIDEFSLLSSQVSLENLRPALAGLQVQYQQSLLTFTNSLGLPLTADIEPRGEIDPPTIEVETTAVDDAFLRNRFDVRQLQMAQQLIVEQQRAADYNPQSGRAPYLRFGFNVDPAFQGDPWEDSWFDFDAWNQRSGAFTVSVIQPLDAWFPYSQTRNQLSDFETQLEQNRLNLQQALRGAEIRVRGLLLQIRTSQQTVEALNQNVELARRAFELAEIGYENGLRDLLEVETAELDLRDAELNLLEEQKNIQDAILDLEFELNATVGEIREMTQ
jgi:outer membrane protein TolC